MLTFNHLFFQEANLFFNWSLKKAESAVSKVANITAPVLLKIEGPMRKVDNFLLGGMDYVESKVPAVKLSPKEVGICIFFE